MNFKKLMTVAFAAVTFMSQANAIELKFKFNVLSSGKALYACNAGLRHSAYLDQVCYVEGTTDSCDPGACAPGDDACLSRCTCTSLNNAHTGDFLAATTGAWGTTTSSSATVQAGVGSFNQLYADAGSWSSRIDELTFDLGSERYGAQYFVDICYRGSQIEYFEQGIQSPTGLLAQATVTDIAVGNGLSYTDLSDLGAQVVWSCDTQGAGNLQFARNASDLYDTLDNEVSLGGGDAGGSSSLQAVTSGNTMNFVNTLINSGSNTPRFCKARYYFGEFATSAIRKWQLQAAQVCTFTKIESLPGQNSNGGNGGFGNGTGSSLPQCGGGGQGGECGGGGGGGNPGGGGPTGNNGPGNGEDGQPPGNPPVNDGPGTSPGNPGNNNPPGGGNPGGGNPGGGNPGGGNPGGGNPGGGNPGGGNPN